MSSHPSVGLIIIGMASKLFIILLFLDLFFLVERFGFITLWEASNRSSDNKTPFFNAAFNPLLVASLDLIATLASLCPCNKAWWIGGNPPFLVFRFCVIYIILIHLFAITWWFIYFPKGIKHYVEVNFKDVEYYSSNRREKWWYKGTTNKVIWWIGTL